MTKTYHARVHYRTGNKPGRKVSWFRNIKADSETDAGNKAIQKVVNRKPNTGVVEVDTVEVLGQRPTVTSERAKIVAWLRASELVYDNSLADAIEAGEHWK